MKNLENIGKNPMVDEYLAKIKEEKKLESEEVGKQTKEKEIVIRPKIRIRNKELAIFRIIQGITGWSEREIIEEALRKFLRSKYAKRILEGLKKEIEEMNKEKFFTEEM
jgi:hypothetical protein